MASTLPPSLLTVNAASPGFMPVMSTFIAFLEPVGSLGTQSRSFHMRQQGVVDDFAFSIEADQHFQLTAKTHGN